MKVYRRRVTATKHSPTRYWMLDSLDNVESSLSATRKPPWITAYLKRVLPRFSQALKDESFRADKYLGSAMAYSWHEKARGYVYAFSFRNEAQFENAGPFVDPGSDGRYIKIGYSISPYDRLKGIQHPAWKHWRAKLQSPVMMIPCKHDSQAEFIENIIHGWIRANDDMMKTERGYEKGDRLTGEWYCDSFAVYRVLCRVWLECRILAYKGESECPR